MAFALVVFLFLPAVSHAGTDYVLLLHSYNPGLKWTKKVTEGIRQRLQEEKPDLKLQIEHMDTKRFFTADYRDNLFQFYRQKFKGREFDLVIAADDHAFNFAKKYRAELFPGVPLAFMGVNYYKPSMIQGMKKVTGIVERLCVKPTLQTALELHPGADTIYVINDQSKTGRSNKRAFKAVKEEFEDDVNFTFLTDYSMPSLLDKVSQLPENSFVFLLSFNQDNRGKTYTYARSGKLITGASNRPAYGIWNFYLDRGVVGGKVASGVVHGRLTAEMALKILDGKPAASIPVDRSHHCVYRFDYNALTRYDVDLEKLPPSSEIINQPSPFYQLSPRYFWGGIMTIVFLSFLVLIAVIVFFYQRKLREETVRRRQFLQQIIDASPNLVSVRNREGDFVLTNRSMKKYLGRIPESFNESSFAEVLSANEHCRQRLKAEKKVLDTGEPVPVGEEKLVDPETDEDRWFLTSCQPVRGVNGQGLKVLTISTEITQLKKTESQLEASLEEKETLIQEIHHRIKNNLFTIISLLEMQKIRFEDERIRKPLRQSVNRVHSMALIHNQIYGSEEYTDLNFSQYLERLVDSLLESNLQSDQDIEVEYDLTEQVLDLDRAIPCALVVNELVTNAISHGLSGRETGTLRINSEVQNNLFRLSVSDNGRGLPEDFSLPADASLGLKLVSDLVGKQLQGSLDYSSDEWTTFEFAFKLKA